MATDWMSLLGTSLPGLLKAGGGLYNFVNNQNVSDRLGAASTASQIDPFGAQNRGMYQQKLADLYRDPTSTLENLPGYQFALDQGLKGVNRQAARTGHYISPNRLYNIADYTTGLAQQTYAGEADRLAQLSGSQFAPNAAAFSNLQGAQAGLDSSNPSTLFGGVGELLDSDIGKAATGAGVDWLKEKMGNPTSGSGATSTQAQGAPSTEIPLDASGAPDLSALSSMMSSGAMLGPGAQAAMGYGTGSAGAAAPTGFFSNTGVGPGVTTGPSAATTAGQGTASAGAGAGAAGAYLGGKLMSGLAGEENPGTTGVGGAMGAATTAAALQAAGYGSMGAAGAAGAGAAGGASAMAGPLVPLAIAMMAHGGWKSNQAESKARKEMAPKLFGGVDFDNPSYTKDGKDYFNWASPKGDEYYLDRSVYDNLQSGDIDLRYTVFGDKGNKLGVWDNTFGEFRDNDWLQNETEVGTANRADSNNATSQLGQKLFDGSLEQPTQPGGLQAWNAAGLGNAGTAAGNTGGINVGDGVYTPEGANQLWGTQGGN